MVSGDANNPFNAFPVEEHPAAINNNKPNGFNNITHFIDDTTPAVETNKITSRETRKGNSLLTDSLGFTYTRKRESPDSVAWI